MSTVSGKTDGTEKTRISQDTTRVGENTVDDQYNPSVKAPLSRADAERRLVRKLDCVLLPLFTLIYVCNFIDRTAIGNARVAGLEKDLNISGNNFNQALTFFYAFYTATDIPSNLILKKYGPTWLAVLVMSFGLVALGSTFMKSFAGLIVTRVFLGLAEGGTLAGLIYTLAQFYRRQELVLRIGIFVGLAPSLAGAFGGLLTSGLLRVPDIGVVTTWRKIFLIEGVITTGIGIILLFAMPAGPTKTRLLTADERILAVARLRSDLAVMTMNRREATTWRLVLRSFNTNTIVCTLIFLVINISFQGLSIFLPTIVNGLGHYSPIEVQLRTVPPYLASGCWAVLTGIVSYKFRLRFAPLLCSLSMMVAGYALAIASEDPRHRYAACFLMVAGGASGGPIVLAWGTENAAPETMRAVASAAIPGIGSLGSIISVWTYVHGDGPRYLKGNMANLVCSSLAVILTIYLATHLYRENLARRDGRRDHVLEGKTQEEIEEMGCRHPDFRYQL